MMPSRAAEPGLTEPRPGIRSTMVAVGLAVLGAVLFLGESLWPGRVVAPYPLRNLEPMRSEATATGTDPDALLQGTAGLGDKWNQSIAWDRTTQDELQRNGRVPLWSREIAGGAPFIPQMGQVYQPWNALLLLPIPSVECYGPWFLLHLAVIAWLVFGFLTRCGVGASAGWLGTVAVCAGLWTQARIHHNVILSAALPAFGMFSAVLRLTSNDPRPRAAAAWLAFWTGLSWLGGLPQVSLLISAATGGLAILLTVQGAGTGSPPGRLRSFGGITIAMAIGGLIGVLMIGPIAVAAAHTARGLGTPELFAQKALDPIHLLGLVWPDLLHWPSDTFYGPSVESVRHSFAALWLLDWQRLNAGTFSYAETALFVGTVPLLLALIGMAACWRRDTATPLERRRRWIGSYFAGLAALGLAAALAIPPIPTLAAATPGINTGDLKRWIFLPAMSLPILAAFGCHNLLQSPRVRWPIIVLALWSLLCALLWSYHQVEPRTVAERFAAWCTADGALGATAEQFLAAVQWPTEAEANQGHLASTFARATIVAGCAALLLQMASRFRGRLRLIAPLGLSLLTLAELLHAGHGTIVPVRSEHVTTPPRVLAPLIEATRAAAASDPPAPPPRLQRLVDASMPGPAPLLRPNLGAYYGVSDLSAYNPLSPRRMEEYFEMIEPGIALGGAGVDLFRTPASLQHPLTRLIGADWILAPDSLAHQLVTAGFERRSRVEVGVPFGLYERKAKHPRVSVLEHAISLPDHAERIERLSSTDHDPQQAVVLEVSVDAAAPTTPPKASPAASVRSVRHDAERVEVTVEVQRPAYLRLADPWDPGWTVRVDGAPRELLVADHYLRAVAIRPGDRSVVFAYDGATVRWPRYLGGAGIVLLLLLWLSSLLGAHRTRTT